MRFISLLAIVLIFNGSASLAWAAPPALDINDSPLVTPEQISSLLATEKHLPNVKRVAFYETWQNKPQELAEPLEVFKAQRNAISQVKSQKLLSFIPALVPYLDYPSEGGIRDFAPSDAGILRETLSSWPAFDAIYSFGNASSAPLTDVVRNSSIEMHLRVTALQVLQAIDKAQAQLAGKELTEYALTHNQKPLAGLVEAVISGEKPFWGINDFLPITMSAEQIRKILAVDKHIETPSLALQQPKLLPPDTPVSQREAVQVRHNTYLQQKEAIRNAGELKLSALVPALIHYMDYPASGSSYVISSGSYSLRNRRLRWPALDTILKMGTDAVLPLQKVVADETQTFKLRRTALSVLRDLSPDDASVSGQLLLEEAKQKGDKENQDAIEYVLQRSDNTSPFTSLKGK